MITRRTLKPIPRILTALALMVCSLGASQQTETALKGFDETDLGELNSLRNTMPETMVTTYTYDLLVGVTSITDPKGYTTFFSYDGFNRLKEVRDADGNLVNDYRYHYKGQAQP
ncbi:RHS repeat domain-containing protein [Arenibacter sp. GZD96]|uniref:RHS repeat domain-containing protein n=1 Tax=Aurantibrevibacter litoralis TaxID=3106030 RepID=UPI002AFECBC1|nr:RHS repeat domain-containing protein [Arenibacter sp. GZD-96]MEA1786089.1 RHS repeat domain-containing protein [Arenibacter sp. GZD-96]